MCDNCIATRKKFLESVKTDGIIDSNSSTPDSPGNEVHNTSSKLSTTVISIPNNTSDYIKGLSWGGSKWNWNYGKNNKHKCKLCICWLKNNKTNLNCMFCSNDIIF